MKITNLILSIIWGAAVLACFIVNLATAGTLSWFYIVLSALAACAVNWFAPQYINKHRLLLIPLIAVSSICLIILVCGIYTSGWWCAVAISALLAAWAAAFSPVYIAKYAPQRMKKNNTNFSIAITAVIIFAL